MWNSGKLGLDCRGLGHINVDDVRHFSGIILPYGGGSFWRAMKDAIGAGRCLSDLHQLYQRTRQMLRAQQEQPIYEFHW
jgi:hypothetical protein